MRVIGVLPAGIQLFCSVNDRESVIGSCKDVCVDWNKYLFVLSLKQ